MATKFPAPQRPFIAARHKGGPQKPKAIVLHGTVSSDNAGTARNIANWWAGPSSPVSSCHYVTDPKEDIQCVGDHTVAYHCGYNQDSIGVEFCDEQAGPPSRWDDADSRAILKRAARLVAQLCLAYDIAPKRPSIADLKRKGPHGIYGHNDSRLAFGGTTHTDPKDFPWRKFLRMVRREIRRIRREAEPVKTFKVLHAPLHGASATEAQLKNALGMGAISVAFSEAWRQAPWLKRETPGWRVTTGPREERDARGRYSSQEVVLMTRRFREHLEDDAFKISDAAEPLKIAPERWLSYSVDNVHGKPLAVIALHPHAAVKNAWESDRAREFRKAMRALYLLVVALRDKYGEDLDVVVVGDLNYPDLDDDRRWTPRFVFRKLKMGYVTRGIDWVAHSTTLRRVKVTVIRDNGQDHPWIMVEFARR